MFSTKYFRDEKFKDTIKKNSCRLRQKSSVQIGGFLISQTKDQSPSYIQKENKEYINKTIERNKTPKNKLLNFMKSKNIKNNQQKGANREDRQITVKKKISEECSTSIKQRILMKLKEQRIEKLNKIVKNEDNNEINHANRNNVIPKDIVVNRKKFVGSTDIKNIIYRNRKENRKISNTINKEEINESINNFNNNDGNSINFNNNYNSIQSMNINKNIIGESRGILSLKNISTKKFSNSFLEGKYSSNFFMNKSSLSKEKNHFLNRINKTNDVDINNEIEKNNNEYSKDNNKKFNIIREENSFNEINNSASIIKKTKKIKYFSSNYDYYNNNNYKINRNNIHKKENKENLENIINDNKKTIKNIKDGNDNNDLIIVHKKESYFNKRYKYKFIKKNEEEKSKNYNDDIQKSIILNKTSTKPEKKFNYFKDIISKRFSNNHTKKKLRDIQASIKLSTNKAKVDNEYNLTSLGEQNDDKKYYSQHYLSTEKPKIFSKSSFFKNLLINTGDNEDMNICTEERNTRNTIFRNNLKYNLKEIKENGNRQDISSLSNSNIINREKGGISDILKSDKKKYFDKKIKINNVANYNIYNYDYVMKMINEAIQLKNSIDIQSLFSILITNFNNKYLYTFNYKEFPKDIPKFTNCYKYYAIITIPLIFLHKDEYIYKNSSSEVKIALEKFIYISIENIGRKNMNYKKIDSFMDEFKKTNYINEKINMEECSLDIIKIIFKNNKQYIPLKKATEQLLSFAKDQSLEKIINIINDTILYCFNHKQKNSFYLIDQKIGNRNKSFYKLNQLSTKDLNKTISTTPTTPFIRCAMKKNFCLVLDIDETIVHSMNLPFGNYFLLRPGVINFLDELSKIYEIIIFTSSPKVYADGILNKIDIDNNYISHRLYKDHVIFEKGKSVKKLNMIGRDLNKIIFVDNMKSNAKYNLKNLCHVSTWIYDINDEEIIKLKLKLKYIATNNKFKDDIRKGLECNL